MLSLPLRNELKRGVLALLVLAEGRRKWALDLGQHRFDCAVERTGAAGRDNLSSVANP